MGWAAVTVWSPAWIVMARQSRRAFTNRLMLQPVACSTSLPTARAAITMLRVGLDRLALVVVDRPGAQVRLGHPEALLDLPQLVVGVQHVLRCRRAQVGDVALQTRESASLGLEVAVDRCGCRRSAGRTGNKRLFGQYRSGNDGQRSDAHCDQDVCSGGTGGISAPRSSSSSGAWNCTCHSFSSVSLIWN